AVSSDSYPTNLAANREIEPTFDVRLMSGVGHFLFLERPEEFNRLLGQTLAELRAGGAAP
ncbi:MAG TPA: hypothetical protein PKY95_12120, partial [candidate division Zixibacteria bacterium]|nr:hypothetical protein [candidate division Zixibacteria bacterium]